MKWGCLNFSISLRELSQNGFLKGTFRMTLNKNKKENLFLAGLALFVCLASVITFFTFLGLLYSQN